MSGSMPVSKLAAIVLFVLVIACDDRPSNTTSIDNPNLENSLISLVDQLDDPDHYCIDVAGFGAGIRLQDPLQAHTCKRTDNRDEQFTYSSSTGQLYMEEYDLCLQPETLADGSEIYLRECSDIPMQNFNKLSDGTIRLAGDGTNLFCVAVESGAGQVINPVHKRRDLIVKACDGTEPSLITWSFSAEVPAQES